MHNTCVSSSFSVRYRGSPSFSFNDCSCCFNDRFDRHPLLNSASLSSQCCTCCCSNSYYSRVPILNPGYLYGLRQSTLIQWAPYKRLILNGLDRCYAGRFSVCDVDRTCYCENYYSKEQKVCGRRGKLGRGRYRCMVFEEESERHGLCGGGDRADEAEVLLSLLTEDVSDEYFGVRERRGKSFGKRDVEKGGNGGGNNVRSRKKNVESGVLESISKFEYQAKIIRPSDKERKSKQDTRREDEGEIVLRSNWRGRVKKEERGCRLGENSVERVREEEKDILLRENQRGRVREAEQESLSRREDHRQKARKDGSCCSSYYSFSSGEFENDDEIQAQQERFKSESSSAYRKDSRRSQEVVSDEVREDTERHGHSKEYGVVLSKENNQAMFSGASSIVESEWRKKSEKKLTDVSVDKTQYGKESAQNLSTYREDKESSCEKAFGSYSKFDDRNKMSTSLVNINDRTREQNRQTSETGTRMKYKQFKEMSDTYAADLETSSTSHKLYRSGDKNSSKSTSSVQEAKEHHVTAEQIRREEEYRESSHKFAEASKVQEADIRGTSTAERRSEIRMKDQEDHSTRIQSSMLDTEQQHHHSGIVDSRIKHQNLTTDVKKESTTVLHRESDSRIREQDVALSFVYNSSLETGQHLREKISKRVGILESTKGSQEVTHISFPSKSDIGVSVVDEKDKRELEIVMAPAPLQLPATGALHVESTSGLRTGEIVDERLHSGSTATNGSRIEGIVDARLHSGYTALHESSLDKSQMSPETKGDESREQPLNLVSPEDALGSADRLQKSSAHYVGEFVQKVKNEISSSEIHNVKDTYKAKLLSKGEQHNQASLSSYGSEVAPSKEQDSRRSSQGSGTKGPSDEIWDVTEQTIEEPPVAEAVVAESSTESAGVKRSGKSLWNIITDVVRFRWASRSENRSSPSKSCGKSSPNQSTSSETWFSGHEQEESNDFNVQKDSIILTQRSLPIEQQQEEKISSSRVGVSGLSSSKGETKHNRAGVSTSSVVFQKDSLPKSTSLSSNEASSQTNFQATFAVTEEAELSCPLPSLQAPGVLATGETEGSGSGTIVLVDQSVPIILSNTSSPESKGEDLKRRKLQRVDQVQKDQFDEWEEACRIETEKRKTDEMFMKEALLEAKKAADSWEVPVGAVLVQDGKIIARGYNLVEELRDSTAHAEMICIREASNILRTWRLSETTLYVTLEPCPMCAGAILQARIDTVVWGAPNKLLGADGSWIRLFPNGDESGLELSDKPAAPVHPFHPKIVIRRGILSSECADMMQQFFQLRRKKKEKKQEPTTPPSCLPSSHHPSKFLTKMHDAFHLMFCL